MLSTLLFSLTARSEMELKTYQQYQICHSPESFCTNGVFCFYSYGNKVANYVNIELLKVNGTIQDLEIFPTGTSFYTLYSGKDQVSRLQTNSLKGKVLLPKLNALNPSCFCFSPDASKIISACKDGKIHVFSLQGRSLEEIKTLNGHGQFNTMTMSPDMYYIAATVGKDLYIYNYETSQLRLTIPLDAEVKQIVFTSDSKKMYVLCNNSTIYCFEAVEFTQTMIIGDLSEALSFDVTEDGKYLAVSTSSNQITVINTFNQFQRSQMDIPQGGVNDVFFAKLRNGAERLIYCTTDYLVLADLVGREANYTKLLDEELETRMSEWMKQLPNETLEEYNLRVNESTIMPQYRIFQEEIATRLAEQYFKAPEFSLQGYDYSSQTLPISLGQMQQIYLTVPQDELMSFSDISQLEFRKHMYVVNSEDNFELVYVEVFNKATGKQYIFDNREQKSLEFLSLNDRFVPLELIKKSNMQEVKLNEIKDLVLDESMNKSIISSHTKVNVKTNVTRTHDAQGKDIYAFTIAMDYVVDKGFSEQEDYPSGRYRLEESGSAKSLCTIIERAFSGEFSSYIKSGKAVTVSLTGSADALNIRNVLGYNGEYGDFDEFPAYDNGVLCGITLNPKKGIRTNNELAFIRAVGLKEEICKVVKGLEDMKCNFVYNILVSENVGSDQRRVSVSFTFPDTFE